MQPFHVTDSESTWNTEYQKRWKKYCTKIKAQWLIKTFFIHIYQEIWTISLFMKTGIVVFRFHIATSSMSSLPFFVILKIHVHNQIISAESIIYEINGLCQESSSQFLLLHFAVSSITIGHFSIFPVNQLVAQSTLLRAWCIAQEQHFGWKPFSLRYSVSA